MTTNHVLRILARRLDAARRDLLAGHISDTEYRAIRAEIECIEKDIIAEGEAA